MCSASGGEGNPFKRIWMKIHHILLLLTNHKNKMKTPNVIEGHEFSVHQHILALRVSLKFGYHKEYRQA